jgi:hypothetical protein
VTVGFTGWPCGGSPSKIKTNSGWQRDLSIGYEKVGDVLVAQGKLQDALDAYDSERRNQSSSE